MYHVPYIWEFCASVDMVVWRSGCLFMFAQKGSRNGAIVSGIWEMFCFRGLQ